MVSVIKVNESQNQLEAEPEIGKREALKVFGLRLIGKGW
jgi:hypothetical protein